MARISGALRFVVSALFLLGVSSGEGGSDSLDSGASCSAASSSSFDPRTALDSDIQSQMAVNKLFRESTFLLSSGLFPVSKQQFHSRADHPKGRGAGQAMLEPGVADSDLQFSGWCPKNEEDDKKKRLVVDLADTFIVTGFAMQGRGHSGKKSYVSKVSVETSLDGSRWVSQGEFPGNFNSNSVVRRAFAQPVTASFVKFRVLEYEERASLRVDVLVANL